MAQSDKTTSFKDVLVFLKHDHDTVKTLFEKFEKLGKEALTEKYKLVDQICVELTVHAILEEELFYPAVRRELESIASLTDEALTEHQGVKDLILEIQDMAAEDESFDAKVRKLSEQTMHHVEKEEQEMFPKVKESGMDLVGLLDKVMARKQELMEEEAS